MVIKTVESTCVPAVLQGARQYFKVGRSLGSKIGLILFTKSFILLRYHLSI